EARLQLVGREAQLARDVGQAARDVQDRRLDRLRRGDVVVPEERLRFAAEHGAHLLGVPAEEAAFLALGVGVGGRREAAGGQPRSGMRRPIAGGYFGAVSKPPFAASNFFASACWNAGMRPASRLPFSARFSVSLRSARTFEDSPIIAAWSLIQRCASEVSTS